MDIKEAVTRRLGPLPAWAWGLIAGGALVAYSYLRGGSNSTDSGDDTEDAEVDPIDIDGNVIGAGGTGGTGSGGSGGYQDTSGVQGIAGPKGDPGERGATGATGRPGCPSGYKPIRTGGRWRCSSVRRPRCGKGRRLRWDPNSFRWSCVRKTSSLSADDLHQVPHEGYAFAPNGAPPTISEKDVPGIALMPPDRTPRMPLPVPLYTVGTSDPPIVPRVPPSRNSRPYGRPYHGRSHEG